jgi:multidrug transporter EmrE-like cation transporter
MNWLSWALVLTGVFLNAMAQLLLKSATRVFPHFDSFGWQQLTIAITGLSQSVSFWGGMICYAVSVCVWIGALSRAPVSTAYPMLSLGYVVVTCAAAMFLGESLTIGKMFGIALICAGVILVSRSPT